MPVRIRERGRLAFASVALACSIACSGQRGNLPPSIEFSHVPEAGAGGPARTELISGRVRGASHGQRLVLFARSGTWWVQPLSNQPFTSIAPDATWQSQTHMGTEYAAVLVNPGYTPPRTTDTLPSQGRGVVTVASVPGRTPSALRNVPPKRLRFSGYDWDVRQMPSDSGGVMHTNLASNAWTDSNGWLHLRIAKEHEQWTCAEISLQHSLGYGEYSFHIRETPRLEPATVLGMFTWDDLEAGQNHREIDIELSQWGDPASKNAQFTIQPYYIAANVFRFAAPASSASYSFRWEPERVKCQAAEDGDGTHSGKIAEHVFTSGIPSPGSETVHVNLYTYGKSRTPQERGVEVVIDKFEFLP